MKSKAQIAYEAYYDCAGGKSLATGQQLPPWDRLSPGIQAAWFAAAVTDNDFSWEELLDSRFNDFGVYPNSVGQAIYALTVTKGLASKQNPALKRKYDEFGAIMRTVYEKPADPHAQDEGAEQEPNKEQ